jgi:hypothetical protein
MTSYKFLLFASILTLGNGDCSESETAPDVAQTEGDSSQAKNDEGPSIAETIAQITNDCGAGFGGDR